MDDGGNVKERVLIGSCGGLTGNFLARRIKANGSFEIHAFDTTDLVATRVFVEKLHILPRASSPDFVKRLCELLSVEGINYYLPTHSLETRVVSKNERIIGALAPEARFLVSPFETFLALDDKESLYYSLEKEGFITPRLLDDRWSASIRYPIFMKRRVGSGGVGSMIVPNAALHEALKETYRDALFFEYVEGPELTIDCMFDCSGGLLGVAPRLREKMLGGAAIVSKTCEASFAHDLISRLSDKWEFRGCVNVQCIVKDGLPFVTDVNLRYPSGGLPLTVRSGMDIPMLTLRILRGDLVAPSDCMVDGCGRTMLRWLDEVYIEDGQSALRL